MFKLRTMARVSLLAILLGATLVRAAAMIISLQSGDERAFLAFPLTVIFPAALVILLASMPPAKSREGLLMRVGTIIQLLLIIMLPAVSLYLALGLPVVFLAVELFETRVPLGMRMAISRMVVA